MGFSVPLDFHKNESDCHLIRFKAISKGDSLYLATVIYKPGNREIVFEQGQIIEEKTEYDNEGEFSALVSGLILCLENDIKTVFIEGVCDKIRKEDGEKGEFVNNLFSQFTYVYFKGEINDTEDLDRVINTVLDTGELHYKSGVTA
jgi:hypothetical protein